MYLIIKYDAYHNIAAWAADLEVMEQIYYFILIFENETNKIFKVNLGHRFQKCPKHQNSTRHFRFTLLPVK